MQCFTPRHFLDCLALAIAAAAPCAASAQAFLVTTVIIHNASGEPLRWRSDAAGGATADPPPARVIAPGATASFRLVASTVNGLKGSVTYESDSGARGCRLRYATAALVEGKWQFASNVEALPRSRGRCIIESTQAQPTTGRQTVRLTVR